MWPEGKEVAKGCRILGTLIFSREEVIGNDIKVKARHCALHGECEAPHCPAEGPLGWSVSVSGEEAESVIASSGS